MEAHPTKIMCYLAWFMHKSRLPSRALLEIAATAREGGKRGSSMQEFWLGILIGIVLGMLIGYVVCGFVVTRYRKK